MTDHIPAAQETAESGARTLTRTRLVAVGAALPIVIAAVASGLMLGRLPQLPDPVAVHWTGSGPDGFGPAWSLPALLLGMVVLYTALAVGISWPATVTGRLAPNQKFLLAVGTGLSTMLGIGLASMLDIQRGLGAATEATDSFAVGRGLIIGAAVGVGFAAIAWSLLPKAGATDDSVIEPAPLELATSERVTWSRTIRLSLSAVVVIAVAVGFAVVAVVWTAVAAPAAIGVAVCALVLVMLAALCTGWWRVTVDRRGLRARSALGWPRVIIPAEDIRAVHAVTANPTADFGGWGWRMSVDGRTGIIMRAGSAIQVTRASGKRFVVTVDDAETAASVLAGLLANGQHAIG